MRFRDLPLALAAILLAAAAAISSAAETKKIRVEDIAALRENVGRQVTAVGTVARTGKPAGGPQFLNFDGTEFTVVCLPGDLDRFPEPPAEAFHRKSIEVTGKVETYKGRLQMRIREPAQVRVRGEPAAAPKPTGDSTKSTINTSADNWVSPAGLRYQGRDPSGLTRLQHVARHAGDLPDRDGPHGVFDGGIDQAIATIDEAWKLAVQRKTRPVVENQRSTYTVNMGRRIGYLGGRAGSEQGHPPLNRVFIVVETGTQNVVTAYPK
jgi:hypothetical protein